MPIVVVMPQNALNLNATAAFLGSRVNLTDWREHRRKKRFLVFQNAGTCKLVTGITFPVDLGDKRPWRQLVVTYNIQYQFPLPTEPIYWWDKWDRRNFAENNPKPSAPFIDYTPTQKPDEAQQFLFAFVENLMDRYESNGRECLLKAICENAQIHEHQGLYAEVLHRLLIPHRHLQPFYLEAKHLGQKGVDCQKAFPNAKNCFLDKYTHVRENFMKQTFVKK